MAFSAWRWKLLALAVWACGTWTALPAACAAGEPPHAPGAAAARLGEAIAAAAPTEPGKLAPDPKAPPRKPNSGKASASKASGKRVFSQITTTTVFGLEGQGNTFVYIFDRSGSMSEFSGRPLAAAKSELLKSVRTLRPTNQFLVIFYNHEMAVFNPFEPQPPRLIFGDDQSKEQAERFVTQIRAGGGTRHMEPLKLALRLGPDVIFFLTDAAEPELTARQLQEISQANKGSVINTIEFGVGDAAGGDNFMKRLARQNAGSHVYIDVSRLPRP